MRSDQRLKSLDRLVGYWTTVATHPEMPGVTVRGSVEIEWLEGQKFLIHRARTDHPDFPDSVSLIGFTASDRVEAGSHSTPASADDETLSMHYYDSRGVFRKFATRIDEQAWRGEMLAPGFSQRFTYTFADHGDTLDGLWQLSKDEAHWNDDLKITCRRKPSQAKAKL